MTRKRLLALLLVGAAALSFNASAQAWQIQSGAASITPPRLFWGLRAYEASYYGSKLIRLRRASDNAESDINSSAIDGSLDTATATTFCAATTCYGVTLYEQIGNLDCSGACDATQATTAKQPIFTFSCLGAHPCFNFDRTGVTTGHCMTTPANTQTQAHPLTLSAVTVRKNDSSGTSFTQVVVGYGEWSTGTGTDGPWMVFGRAISTVDMSGAVLGVNIIDGDWYAVQAVFNNSLSVLRANSLTEHLGGTGGFDVQSGQIFHIGGDEVCGDQFADMLFEEVAYFGYGFTYAQRVVMETQQRNYWGF